MTPAYDREASMLALLRALPYIRLFKGRTFVVKIGGGLCSDERALHALAEQIAVLRELGIRVVLVHGGGPQATALSKQLGLETTFVEGRRVTDAKTLEVAVMTLNGLVNTSVVAAFRSVEVPAVGVSGVDAGLIRAVRRPPQVREVEGRSTTVDYGFVGDVVGVNLGALEALLDAGTLPVVSPICADERGQLLNVNADTVASTLALELKAEKLIFITDTAGLLERRDVPSSLISYIDLRGLADLQSRGAIGAGMLPKVKAAREALLGGVRRVHMVGLKGSTSLLVEVFTNEGAGTLIVKDAAELLPAEQQSGALAPVGSAGK